MVMGVPAKGLINDLAEFDRYINWNAITTRCILYTSTCFFLHCFISLCSDSIRLTFSEIHQEKIIASAALSRSRSEVGFPIHYGHHDLSFAKFLISKVKSNTKKDKQRAETNALNLKPDEVNVRLWLWVA